MKMRTCISVTLAMAVLIGVMAPAAGAQCTVQGVAVGLSNYYNTTTWDLWTIVYIRSEVDTPYNPSFLTYFVTKEPGLINLCNMSVVNRNPVQISGSEASCPTAGTIRYGGEIEQMKAW